MARYPGIEPPRYLVSTTRLIGVGYTFYRAKRLVQMDPEWYYRDHVQAMKRINRIGQTQPTSIYILRCVGSEVERTIYDRQYKRINLVNIILDPEKFDLGRSQQGIGDDGNTNKKDNDNNNTIPVSDFFFPTEC